MENKNIQVSNLGHSENKILVSGDDQDSHDADGVIGGETVEVIGVSIYNHEVVILIKIYL